MSEKESYLTNIWDPTNSTDWDNQKYTNTAMRRLHSLVPIVGIVLFRTVVYGSKEYLDIQTDPLNGIYVTPDPDNLTKFYALIVGPEGTPYENGFFYFFIRFPPNYPFDPPRVKFLTTSSGTRRFNPNLYKNGKVCLSTLGTWIGPGWAATQTLSSVLLSIQSLLNEKPYHNEPGYEKECRLGESLAYNRLILHETLKIAVCENLEKNNLKEEYLKAQMIRLFLQNFDYYIRVCQSNLNLDGQKINDTLFNENCGQFEFGKIFDRLEQLKTKLSK